MNDQNPREEVVTFKITEVNLRRRSRGVEYIRVNVLEDGEKVEWLWMTPQHIEMNKKEFGSDCFLNKLEDF